MAIIRQIGEALSEVHQAGIVHRDAHLTGITHDYVTPPSRRLGRRYGLFCVSPI